MTVGSVFRGFVLGLSLDEVKSVLRAKDLSAELKTLPPPLSLALGVPRRRLLRAHKVPSIHSLHSRLLLLTLWTGTAIAMFTMIASFYVDRLADVQAPALLTSAGLAVLTGHWTHHTLKRIKKADPEALRTLFSSRAPLDGFLISGEGVLIALGGASLFLLVTFLLFVSWLPIVLILTNSLSLGELWRAYRTVFIEVSGGLEELPAAGRELLRAGGVLSQSWNDHLDQDVLGVAESSRKGHARLHGRFVLFGGSSLGLALSLLVANYVPWAYWDHVSVIVGGATALSFLLLIGPLISRRLRRRELD